MNENENENENELTVLTANREIDKGWTLDENGNWVVSAHDRRRLVTTEAAAAAELFNGKVPLIMVKDSIRRHSTSKEDGKNLEELLDAWLAKNS